MRKILIIILFFSSVLLTGCGDERAFILMKSEPLTASNAKYYEQTFLQNQRIYYAIVNPKGFKDNTIKIEIIKKNTKVNIGGLSIQYAQNLPINKDKKYYRNYFTISSSGQYFMQVFEIRKPQTCIARYDFRVK